MKQVEACCDCCGKFRLLTQCWVSGMETWACDECRGMDEPDPDEARERQRDYALWDKQCGWED